ncbi:MAG TPA: tetratricopeptide repeat protein [Chitinivibrionales bacterium]|nr:tetratricopeptide repeat protein [Chitinivibrionales bacterium]
MDKKELQRLKNLTIYLFPILSFAGYVFFWNAPKVHLINPWYEAFHQVIKAQEILDPLQRQRILNEGGEKLIVLSRRFPQHARVQYYLGTYYDIIGKYDSAVVHAKEAIRLGSGSIVNRVDDLATELLVSVLMKKARLFIDNKDNLTAQYFLREAYAIQPNNIPLLKTIGNVFLNSQSIDSAQWYFGKILTINQLDDEALYFLGYIASTQKRFPDAIDYLERAVAINPNRTDAKQLLSLLKKTSLRKS